MPYGYTTFRLGVIIRTQIPHFCLSLYHLQHLHLHHLQKSNKALHYLQRKKVPIVSILPSLGVVSINLCSHVNLVSPYRKAYHPPRNSFLPLPAPVPSHPLTNSHTHPDVNTSAPYLPSHPHPTTRCAYDTISASTSPIPMKTQH